MESSCRGLRTVNSGFQGEATWIKVNTQIHYRPCQEQKQGSPAVS